MDQLYCIPTILRLNKVEDLDLFRKLIAQGVRKIDNLQIQLHDIVKTQNPNRKLSIKEMDILAIQHVGDIDWEYYGCWVFYPWKNVIIHLLDQQEYSLVRTIRNQYKLTPTEQNLLSNKKVGIIGLSVGHSVAMALAVERVCCEIRIADFDKLELSNMNRIRTSVLNIGLPKTIIVAREIAELDPFIKVKCFEIGINERNIDSFFEDGGKLDIIIEECDSVEVKILVRQIARRKRVPIVMDTSDRGMIDVERYDLDPDYPILHGLIDSNLDYNFLKGLSSSKEKLPFILPFAGIDNISDRLAASALEIESSITSWPQLGTEVQIGGALAAKAVRTILLEQDVLSKRIYTDSTEIGIDKFVHAQDIPDNSDKFNFLDLSGHVDFISSVCPGIIKEIFSESLVAPSASNLQPWNYLLKDHNYFICTERINDSTNRDQDFFLSALGVGSILETLELLCVRRKIKFYYELVENSLDIILIRLKFENLLNINRVDRLVEYLPKRCTDRTKLSGTRITTSEILRFHDLTFSDCGATDIQIFHNDDQINEIIEVISISDKFRLLSAKGHEFFFRKEIQLSETQTYPTGIHIKDLLLDRSQEIGLRVLARESVRATLHDLELGGNISLISESYNEFNNCIVIISVVNLDLENLLKAGRAIQRFWLSAAALELSVHPMTSPTPLIYEAKLAKTRGIEFSESEIVETIKRRLQIVMGDNRQPVFVCRLFRNFDVKIEKSKRMNINEKFYSL